jgi:hypothetical protein
MGVAEVAAKTHKSTSRLKAKINDETIGETAAILMLTMCKA